MRKLLRSDFLRHGALVFSATTLVNLFNFAFHFLISRKLGVTSYGELYSLFAALAIGSVFPTILSMVIVKYVAELSVLADLGKVRALARLITLNVLAVALVLLAVIALFRAPLAGYLHIVDTRAVVLTGVLLTLNFLINPLRGMLQGVQDFRRFAVSIAIEASLKALFGISLVYAGFGLLGGVGGYCIASVFALAYTGWAVRGRLVAPASPLHVDVRRLLQTSGAVACTMLTLAALSYADVLLVKHFFDPQSAGLYGAVSLTGKILLLVVGFIPMVVLPKATNRVASGLSPVPILAQAFATTGAISILGLLLFAFAPGFTVAVVAGRAFAGAAPYVFPYGLAMTLLAATTLIATYKISLHRFDFVVPLLAVAIGEIVAIHIWHEALWQVVRILLAGHLLSVVACMYKIAEPIETPALETAVPA